MRIIRSIDDLDTAGCVVVPTMGALHAGHAALIERGVREAERIGRRAGCVVSIFVNPTQFNEPGDLEVYPRTEWEDLSLCADLGVSSAFVPGVEVMYPRGEEIWTPAMPAVATEPGLEDAGRDGHFAGVCQVVARLFELTRPAVAVFGEKDWQQLCVVRAMVGQERMGVEIIAEPIVRDGDGLAMSSRNARLSPAARAQALSINRALREAQTEGDRLEAQKLIQTRLAEADIEPAYAVVRDARTLLEPTKGTTEYRALVAAFVGGVRLLDNMPWCAAEI